MRTPRHRIVAASLVVAGLLLAPGVARAQTALRKAGRGLAAMTTSFLEVPGNMYRGGQEEGAGGVFLGFAKGLGMIVPRVLVGVYELVTTPIPAPAGFRPILEPEFPWSYFENGGGTPRRARRGT